MRWRATIGLCFWFAANTLATPLFTENDIRASRVAHVAPENQPAKPAGILAGVDMARLILLPEVGGQYLILLDGDKLEVIHRFKHRAAIQGDLQFTQDGRYFFLATGDGWISKFDIWQLKIVAEIRAGIKLQNIALSGDGKFLAVANVEPHTMVLLDADLNLRKIHQSRSKDGRIGSGVAGVLAAPLRQSFVIALADVPEIWEISTNPAADEIAVGMVHDFQYKEGAFIPGFLNPRRSTVVEPIDDFILTPSGNEFIGVNRRSGKAVVVHLDVRKKIADLTLPDTVNFPGAIAWRSREALLMALPNLKDGLVSIIDLANWKTIRSLQMPGPGLLTHSVESNDVAWVGSASSPIRDIVALFDKRTLEKTAVFKPAPGKAVANVTFARDGRHMLARIAQGKSESAEIIVLDAATFKQVKRMLIE